jgi:hypothetical protein
MGSVRPREPREPLDDAPLISLDAAMSGLRPLLSTALPFAPACSNSFAAAAWPCSAAAISAETPWRSHRSTPAAPLRSRQARTAACPFDAACHSAVRLSASSPAGAPSNSSNRCSTSAWLPSAAAAISGLGSSAPVPSAVEASALSRVPLCVLPISVRSAPEDDQASSSLSFSPSSSASAGCSLSQCVSSSTVSLPPRHLS